MKLASQYDVVVFGESIGALACAAQLADQRRKVLYLEKNNYTIDHINQCFTVHQKILRNDSREVLLSQSLIENFALAQHLRKNNDFILNLLTPSHRFSFLRNIPFLKKEVSRNFNNNQKKFFFDFFQALEATGQEEKLFFFERGLSSNQISTAMKKNLKKSLGKIYSKVLFQKKSQPLAMFLEEQHLTFSQARESETLMGGVLSALSHAYIEHLSPDIVARSIGFLINQSESSILDFLSFKKACLGKVLSAGGAIKHGLTIHSLVCSQNRLSSILLSSHEGLIHANHFICAEDQGRLYSSLPAASQDHRLLRMLQRTYPASWEYSFIILLRKKKLPIGSSNNMVLISDFAAPLLEDNFLKVRIFDEYGGVIEDLRACKLDEPILLKVSIHLPYQRETLNKKFLRRMSGKVMQKLFSFFPYLDQNIEYLYPNFVEDVHEIEKEYPYANLNEIPERLLNYYVSGGKNIQDFNGMPWTTPNSNLYFIGRAIWPFLGTQGELLATEYVCRDLMCKINESEKTKSR